MSHAANNIGTPDAASPALCSGGVVGGAPSREDLLADYRLTIGQILMTPGWNAAAHAVLGARCAAIRAQLGTPKRTPNVADEPHREDKGE